MNKQCFQVNVEMATPECDANCPNLQINVDDVKYKEIGGDNFRKERIIRCVNDTWCQQLYNTFEENRKSDI